MTQPTVVFPAYCLGSKELLHSLVGMPDYVLPIVEPRFLERTGYAGNCLVDDFRDLPRLLTKLDEWLRAQGRSITGVLGIDDEDQFTLSRAVAQHFKVPFHDDSTLSIASNKLLMKQQFVRHSVPTGRFVLLDAHALSFEVSIGFPNVLKTLTGSGSEYVFRNDDPVGLEANVRYLRRVLENLRDDPRYGEIVVSLEGEESRFDTRRTFLVEEYLTGDEFSCDFLVDGARVELIRLVKKLDGGKLGLFGGFYLMNERSALEEGVDPAELTRVCEKIARALGVSRGVQMLDFKRNDAGLRVIETSIRPGFSSFIALMDRLYGDTSLSIAARLTAREHVSVAIPEVEGLVIHLFAERAGILERIDIAGLEALRSRLEVLDVWLYGKPGDTVEDSSHDHFDMIQGYVLVKDPGRENVANIAEAVRGACVIEMRSINEGNPPASE